jgi:hypothetical protein
LPDKPAFAIAPAPAHPQVMSDQRRKGKYSATLAELEASARVPVEEQVAEQPEPPAQAPLSQGEVDRQTLLRITGGV